MKLKDLADELRERQYDLGHVPRFVIDTLSDEQLLGCYTRCADCGEPFASNRVISAFVREARNAAEFHAMLDEVSGRHFQVLEEDADE